MEQLCFNGYYLKRMARVKEFSNEAVEVVLDDFLGKFCNYWLEEEFVLQSGARAYERTETRKDGRSGHYTRSLITSRGQVKLRVPRGSNIKYSFTLFEKFKRRTKHFEDVVIDSILLGHSSRKASKFFSKQFGANSISHQTAISTFKRFGDELKRWRTRRLRDGAVVLVLDAVWLKGAADGHLRAKPVLFAYAVYEDGREEVLDFEMAYGESEAAWSRFCHKIYNRGLCNVKLVVKDDCPAIESMVATYWPEAISQDCVFHLMQNVVKRLRGSQDKKRIIADIREVYAARNEKEFYVRLNAFKARHKNSDPTGAVKYYLSRASRSVQYFKLEEKYWSIARTTNRLERFFEELNRRIKSFRRFPNSGSCERWLYALTMEIKPDSLGVTNALESQQSS